VRIYVDTSALIKRAAAENHSDALIGRLAAAVEAGDELGASSLAWVEVERALRFLRSLGAHGDADLPGEVRAALSGIDEIAVTDQVLRAARWIGADQLRSLDALHLATAVLDGTDLMITYDERLAAAAADAGIAVESPGVRRS
jgi:predicted nucleic acid-binding protein